MVIMRSGRFTSIMAAADSLQDPYLATLYLNTLEHIKLYNKAANALSESYRCDLKRSKWKDFYQELEYDVSNFVFNASVQVVTAIDPGNVPTESKNIIHSYNSIT